eukprot:822108-Pyramimonas_sp.AAC.1
MSYTIRLETVYGSLGLVYDPHRTVDHSHKNRIRFTQYPYTTHIRIVCDVHQHIIRYAYGICIRFTWYTIRIGTAYGSHKKHAEFT